MTSKELRQKFLNFFEKRGHAIIPSASLMPEHDPTVLFTTAGMHPLTPYLLGEKHPAGKRLVNVQKCVRTGDIDDVGGAWHLTFFEMLGNWSLGDYWKKEAIEWSFEFLTEKKHLDIPAGKISVTVFSGDQDASRDEESARIWQNLGVPQDRIFYLPKEDNWWGPAGQTGPCGPCTEMFYDTGKEKCGLGCQPGCKCGKYAEIWNDVFMEYNKTSGGEYEPLKQKNVDTGMGIERTIAVLNGFDNVYETELFKPIIEKIEELSGKKYEGGNVKTMRIIADHVKATTFILAEGLEPSNVGQGYVLRRLIRRTIRYGKQFGIKDTFIFKIADAVINMYHDIYSELHKSREFIEEQLVREEEKFGETLGRGLKELNKMMPGDWAAYDRSGNLIEKEGMDITGKNLFLLFSTYGFPFEISLEELKNMQDLLISSHYLKDKNKIITPEVEKQLKEDFQKEFIKHQGLSRTAAQGTFRSGLADHSEQVVKYHTATHLLLAALREILGPEIYQKGSNITAERLRFDFNYPSKAKGGKERTFFDYPEKLSEEQIKKVEGLVNKKIKEDIMVEMMELPKDKALKIAKISFDPVKYSEMVKVYKIGDFSIELCGGPHVEHTGLLGRFEIIKEESSGAGIRRIRAVLK